MNIFMLLLLNKEINECFANFLCSQWCVHDSCFTIWNNSMNEIQTQSVLNVTSECHKTGVGRFTAIGIHFSIALFVNFHFSADLRGKFLVSHDYLIPKLHKIL
jgi:hypothetical protein